MSKDKVIRSIFSSSLLIDWILRFFMHSYIVKYTKKDLNLIYIC
jgi:hypothetical protein